MQPSGSGAAMDLDAQVELEQADAGRPSELGVRGQDQAGYREAFRQGYPDDCGPRR